MEVDVDSAVVIFVIPITAIAAECIIPNRRDLGWDFNIRSLGFTTAKSKITNRRNTIPIDRVKRDRRRNRSDGFPVFAVQNAIHRFIVRVVFTDGKCFQGIAALYPRIQTAIIS